MSEFSICRLCLSNTEQGYTIAGTPLQNIFEKISSLSLNDASKPATSCYQCYALLQKCLRLANTLMQADRVLNQIVQNGLLISSESIQDIIAPSNKLRADLQISPVQYLNIPQQVKIEVDLIPDIKEEPKPALSPELSINNDFNALESSDSDDNVPLKQMCTKKKKSTDKFAKISEYAREIIFTKQEQIEHFNERSKSLNYLHSSFKCKQCYKGFVDVRAYENHLGKHDIKSGPHECDICHLRYRTVRQLRSHTAGSHARRYACLACNHTSATANQAREHEKWHKGHTYECKLCGQQFRKPTSYLSHQRARHPCGVWCGRCGAGFAHHHGLLMHTAKAHGGDKIEDIPSEPVEDRYCKHCDVLFATKDAWRTHVLSARCGLDRQTCPICSQKWGSVGPLAHLLAHRRALRPPRPDNKALAVVCPQCGVPFTNRSKLQGHINRVHLGLKYDINIVCEVCGKKCTSAASLRYHQRVHTGERPHGCPTCPKRFTDSNQLRIHVRTHTGERPYGCNVCDKRFSQKPALNRHVRIHTGAKPYVCHFCSKTFNQSNSLKLHISSIHFKMPRNRKNQVQNVEDNNQENTANNDIVNSETCL